MITEITPKIPTTFECEKCAFISSNKKDYARHLTTAKHKKFTEFTENTPHLPTFFECNLCAKQYKSRMGLWKHHQKCSLLHNPIEESVKETSQKPPILSDTTVFLDLLKQNQEFKELMIEQSRQMQEMHINIQEKQEENQELQKQLIQAVKVNGSHIENQTNINNNHQKFNLNFFLNEQCKDAINMSDFLENMELDMEDLTETGRLGYVGGISRILVNKLQELDVYKRPLHCTDMKRETLYIKENDEWAKEDNSKDKLKEIVDKVSNKNCRNIKQWTDQHPEYQLFDSSENMEYIKLCGAVLGGLGEEETRQFSDKIVKNIFKEIMVNKI